MSKLTKVTYVGGKVSRREVVFSSFKIKVTLEDHGLIEYEFSTAEEMEASYKALLADVGKAPVVSVEKVSVSSPAIDHFQGPIQDFINPIWSLDDDNSHSASSESELQFVPGQQSAKRMRPDRHFIFTSDKCCMCREENKLMNMFEPCGHFPFCSKCVISKGIINSKLVCPACSINAESCTVIQKVCLRI